VIAPFFALAVAVRTVIAVRDMLNENREEDPYARRSADPGTP
jgi:hypothetical protein